MNRQNRHSGAVLKFFGSVPKRHKPRTAILANTQVLRDLPAQRWVGGSAAPEKLEEARAKTRADVKQLLTTWKEEAGGDKIEGARKKQDPEEQQRAANKTWLQSLEHQLLRGAGISLIDLMPVRRLAGLGAEQRRYFAEVPHPVTQQPQRRSCISDTSGQRFLEVPQKFDENGERIVPSTWHVVHDMGSVGFPAFLWLFLRAGIRGTISFDRFHRMHNDRLEGLKDSGLMLLRVQWVPALNVRVGPWGTASHHESIKAAAIHMFDALDATNELYQHLYEPICWDLGRLTDTDFGTPAHMERIWAELKPLLTEGRRGDAVTLSRWWSWETRGVHFISGGGGAHALLMVLIFLGYRRKWWKRFEETPLSSQYTRKKTAENASAEEGGEEDAGEEAAEECPSISTAEPGFERMTIAGARAAVREERAKSKNTLQYVAWLLARPLAVCVLRALSWLVHPLQEAHTMEYQNLQTQRGTAEWLVSMAAGKYTEVLATFLNRFLTPACATHLGFGIPGVEMRGSSSSDLLKHVWNYMVSVTGSLATTNLWMTEMPPYCFSGLLVPGSPICDQALKRAEHMWVTLLELDRTSLTNDRCRVFTQELVFPMLQWVREVLARLAEVQFREVPADLLSDVRVWSKGFHSTVLVENMFNKLRIVEKKNLSGQIGDINVWHEAAYSGLLQDFDRPLLQPTLEGQTISVRELPSTTFLVDKDESSSLPGELWETISEKKPSWPALSAQGFKEAAIRWLCVSHYKGQWQNMQTVWLSLLLTPGTVVRKPREVGATLILKTSSWGALVWPLKIKKEGENFFLSFAAPPSTATSFLVVDADSLNQWEVMHIKCIGPSSDCIAGGGGMGFRLQAVPPKLSLLKAAAGLGFRNLGVVFLKKLHAHLGLTKEAMPRTAAALVTDLARHVLPPCEGDELDRILSSRTNLHNPEHQDLLSMARDIEEMFELDPPDGEIEEWRRQFNEKDRLLWRHLESAVAQHHEMKIWGAERHSERPPQKAVDWVPGRGLTVKEAKKYAPPGAQLLKDVQRHFRWQVRADWLRPSHSKTFSKSDAGTDNSALLFCLRMAWRKYETLYDDPCPWELGSDLLDAVPS